MMSTFLLIFVKGLIIGLAIAAPVGPIGVLCIQRSLQEGFKLGFISGLGAATADAIYGMIAVFGLTAISSVLISQQYWIRLIGGLFLIYLSVKLFLPKALNRESQNNTDKSLQHAYSTTVFLTLTNPMTIFSFMAIFAGIGLGSQHNDYWHAIFLVLGIFIGSTLWWLLLSGGVAYILHHRITEKSMKIINWISGGIMFLFGLSALILVFKG